MRRVVVAVSVVAVALAMSVPSGTAIASRALHGKKAHGTTKLTVEPGAFPYGVGANDAKPTSVLLWTKTTAATVRLEWSTDPTFASAKHLILTPDIDHDGTLLATIRRLVPATVYYYRFIDESNGDTSRVGSFHTPPTPSTDADVTFAFSGDQDGTIDPNTGNPCSGGDGSVGLAAFSPIPATNPDFYVNLGDTIYADSSCLTAPDSTLDDYRNSYKTNFSYDSFRDLRGMTSFYTQWDDHEVQNDWDVDTVDPTLLANGTQAFEEYDGLLPPQPGTGFYRHFQWGQQAEVFVLDERSFRTTEALRRDVDGNTVPDCNNPETGQPDLAPTLSQTWRDFFASQIAGSGLDQPVPPQCTADLNDPHSTMLGRTQRSQFEHDLLHSTAKFKLVINEDAIQQFFALPYDRWEGYRFERNQILSFIDSHDINNVVWLTTDIHAALAHTVDYNTDTPGTTGGVQGMIDYTVGPIATFTFRSEINAAVGDDTASSVRAFLINVNQNTCTFLGGDGNPTAPWYNFGLVHIDAATSTLTLQPIDYTGTKIAGNGVNGSGRDVFCSDLTLAAQ